MERYPVRLSELRKLKGLKQSDIAKLVARTERHYQDMEYGKINIPMSTLMKLADFYEVSLDYLVGRTDNPKVNR